MSLTDQKAVAAIFADVCVAAPQSKDEPTLRAFSAAHHQTAHPIAPFRCILQFHPVLPSR